MATPYKVFRKVEHDGTAAVTGGETWETIALVEASSGEAAIRQVAAKQELTTGEFFATPQRSFKPVKLAVKQSLTLS